MLKHRAGSSKKAHPLAARLLPLSAFAGRWPLRAALHPSRVAVYGDAVREAKRRRRVAQLYGASLGVQHTRCAKLQGG